MDRDIIFGKFWIGRESEGTIFVPLCVISDFRCRINMDSSCLRSSEKRNSLCEYFFAIEAGGGGKAMAEYFEFRVQPSRADGHNKFRRGISEKIAKLASARFSAREARARHIISFIAMHVRVGTARDIFAVISGLNWYYDSLFVYAYVSHVGIYAYFRLCRECANCAKS